MKSHVLDGRNASAELVKNLADASTIEEIQLYFREDAKRRTKEEVINRFKKLGMKVEPVIWKDNTDYDAVMLVQDLPVHFEVGVGDCLSFIDERHWLDLISSYNKSQIEIIRRNIPTRKYRIIEDMVNAIQNFHKNHPLFSSEKLTDLDVKTGIFENVKTFENWKKDSTILRDVNNRTGVLEDDDEKDLDHSKEMVDGVFIDYNAETCTIDAEDGELKIGVVYDENGNAMTDAISLEIESGAQGFISLKVSDFQKLIQIAQRKLYFPKIF